MEKVKKKIDILEKARWLGVLFGVIMFGATEPLVGVWIATALSMAANLGFFFICEKEKNATICEHVAEDLKAAISAVGNQKCLVETKKLQLGLLTRVYLINAGAKAPVYSQLVIDRIHSSWYKKQVWITQCGDLSSEGEFKDAQEMLDDELYEDIQKMRDDLKSKKK